MSSPVIVREIENVLNAKERPCIAAILCHADDIEYSVGGTFAKYLQQGYRGIYGVLSLCNSGFAPENTGQTVYRPSSVVVPKRKAEAAAAAKFFGAELFQLDLMENCFTDSKGNVIPLDYPRKGVTQEEPPPGGLPLASAAGAGKPGDSWGTEAVRKVAEVLMRFQPALVLGQSVDVNNPDHFAAALIVYKAYQAASKSVEMGPYYIGMCEPGQPDFFSGPPDMLVDITGCETMVEKAFACHFSQGGANPTEAARLRDRWNQWGEKIGAQSAEPFRRLL